MIDSPQQQNRKQVVQPYSEIGASVVGVDPTSIPQTETDILAAIGQNYVSLKRAIEQFEERNS